MKNRQKSSSVHFPAIPGENRDIIILGCGQHRCSSGYREDRKDFPVYGLEYIIQGEGILEAEGKSYRLTGGMAFCYGKGVPHVYYTDPKNPLEKVFFKFSGRRAPEFLRQNLGGIASAVRLADPAEVYAIVERLYAEAESRGVHARQICNSYLEILLLKIGALRVSQSGNIPESLGTYRAAKRMIDRRYEKMRSPYATTRKLHVSPSYLCRLFRQYAKRSPYEYLMTLKLNRAAHLLVASDLSVKQISQELNFRDQYNFSRVFKKFFGVSPKNYR